MAAPGGDGPSSGGGKPAMSWASRAAAAAAAPAPAPAPVSAPTPMVAAAGGAGSASSAAAGTVRTKKSAPKLPSSASRKKEAWEFFDRGCRELLDKWDLLRTAVIEEWGGRSSRHKYEHMVDDLLLNMHEQWLAGHDLHEDTLDVYFLECLDQDFNVDFEDDEVVTQASLLIQDLYRKCAEGDLPAAQHILDNVHTHAITKKHDIDRPRAADDDDDDDDGDDDDDDSGSGVTCSSESEGDDDDAADKPAKGGAGAGGAAASHKHAVDDDGWETIPAPKKGGRGGKAAAAPAAAAAAAPAAAAAAAAPAAAAAGDEPKPAAAVAPAAADAAPAATAAAPKAEKEEA